MYVSLEAGESYEIDTTIFQFELIINMQENTQDKIKDLETKNSNMKKLKLIFFDLENNISLCSKAIDDKDSDLDRNGVFDWSLKSS